MTLPVGTRLGPYEITAAIGAGGMGEVYSAVDTGLKRPTAIKVLPESMAADSERLSRFQREAEVLASLNHPNIAAIYGLERSGISIAIVMELVEGPTLAERITQGPVPVEEALAIARQIAEGLEAAHEQGIVHRDLKPANIKVRPDGTVKILDFGLAKALEPAVSVSPSTSTSPTITSPAMTELGMILGTAAYMSPEQARGKPVDRRADVWAFGCVLFELLTGRRLFDGEDVSLTLAEVIKSEPDWTAVPALPPTVLVCLRQCLKKDPRLRLRDIGEVRLALAGAFDISDVIARPAAEPVQARHVWPWALPAAAIAAIAAAGLTFWIVRSPESATAPQVVRFQIFAPGGSKIPPGTPAISPDGRTLAFTIAGPDRVTRLHVRNMDSTESRALPGTENAVHPFWSPDGRSLAFVSDRTLKRVDVAGGPPRELVPLVTGPWHGSWGRFGDLLFMSRGILRMPAEGGSATPALTLNAKAGETAANSPAFLSDGRRFLIRLEHEGKSDIYLTSPDSTDRTLVLKDVLSAALLAPTPDGRSYVFYMRDDALVAHEFDEQAGAVRGRPTVIVDRIGRVANPPYVPTAGVSKSALAYQVGGDFTPMVLTWVSRSGGDGGKLQLDVTGQNPVLSPDGRMLALDVADRSDRDIWVADVLRGVTSRLTRGGGADRSPVWSPDGRRVAFARETKIYVTNADGSTSETVLANVNGNPRSWSSDNKYLLYETNRALLLWPLGGGEPIPVGSRTGPSRAGRFSPGGRYIAYISDESGKEEAYVQATPPASGRIRLSVSGAIQVRWGRTDRELFFLSADRAMMAVELRPGDTLAAGEAVKLFAVDPTTVFSNTTFDFAADSQRFLFPRLTGEVTSDTPITVVLNWWADLAKAAAGTDGIAK